MHPIYAVGDIHGYSAELERILNLIEADGGRDAHIVFLGDYTDRGPDSKGVIDRLIQGKAQGRNWTLLKGNHDRLFEWFMEDQPRQDPHMIIGYHWFHERIGGRETAQSYGMDIAPGKRIKQLHAEAQDAVPPEHVDFLRNLQLTFETDTLFFCHAGIRPEIPLAKQDEEDLVWIRQEFHSYTEPHPKLIVHGHTPIKHPMHYGNRVNLDAGAGFGDPLCACVFEDEKVWELTVSGRVELRPDFAYL